jgi:hypothetical protein
MDRLNVRQGLEQGRIEITYGKNIQEKRQNIDI